MEKEELKNLMQYIANEMKQYSEIRAGGNLGTAIQGFLIGNQLEKLNGSVQELIKVLREKEIKE